MRDERVENDSVFEVFERGFFAFCLLVNANTLVIDFSVRLSKPNENVGDRTANVLTPDVDVVYRGLDDQQVIDAEVDQGRAVERLYQVIIQVL